MVLKIAMALIFMVVLVLLGYITYQLAAPAFVEVWNQGYRSGGTYGARSVFNGYLRGMSVLFYITWMLGIASNASSSVVSEREEDTWTSLVATPLSGAEILRAKMFGAVWATRGMGFLMMAFWLIGLAAGALHPIGIIFVAIITPLYLWFVAALGVNYSLGSKTTLRAQALTFLTLIGVNGGYLLCCIPFSPDSRHMSYLLAGVTPAIEAALLLGYDDINISGDRIIDGVVFYLASFILYGLAALVLTVHLFANFDKRIDRPRRPRPPNFVIEKDLKTDRDEII